jgi:hypothetical protein
VDSVVIPPMPSVPFTAVVTTEWTRIMPDGSTGTVKNHRTVARDSLVRMFQERRYFSPDGDKQMTRVSELDYQDPDAVPADGVPSGCARLHDVPVRHADDGDDAEGGAAAE